MRSFTLGKIVIVITILVVVTLIVARLFLVDYSIIPQNGMYPGKPAGSRILGWKNPYGGPQDVKRGDVVFFVKSENQVPYKFVWRVIGLPGDQIRVENDILTVNGSVIMKEFVREDAGMRIFTENNGGVSYQVAYPKNASSGAPPPASLLVPENCFFVMGDNRYDARDSRVFGPIAFDTIVAKAFY